MPRRSPSRARFARSPWRPRRARVDQSGCGTRAPTPTRSRRPRRRARAATFSRCVGSSSSSPGLIAPRVNSASNLVGMAGTRIGAGSLDRSGHGARLRWRLPTPPASSSVGDRRPGGRVREPLAPRPRSTAGSSAVGELARAREPDRLLCPGGGWTTSHEIEQGAGAIGLGGRAPGRPRRELSSRCQPGRGRAWRSTACRTDGRHDLWRMLAQRPFDVSRRRAARGLADRASGHAGGGRDRQRRTVGRGPRALRR